MPLASYCPGAKAITTSMIKRNPHKLNQTLADEIRRLSKASGRSHWEMSKIFGVSRSTVRDIVCGRRWANRRGGE